MKKLISAALALVTCCLFSISAFADGLVDLSHVFISDATLAVGDTYTWSYDGDAGMVDYTEQGTALKIVSGQPNDDGGMTFVYEAVAAGSYTFRITDRSLSGVYKTVTVTVADEPTDTPDSQTPDAPAVSAPAASSGSSHDSQPAADTGSDDHGAAVQAAEHQRIAWLLGDQKYTTCPACGYHNWTASDEGYVCDTCGYITRSVKGPDGVKGYTAAVLAPEVVTQHDVEEARRANDAYLAAIRALQQRIAAEQDAYLAAVRAAQG